MSWAIQNCHRRVTVWAKCLTRALGNLVASRIPVPLHSCLQNHLKPFSMQSFSATTFNELWIRPSIHAEHMYVSL